MITVGVIIPSYGDKEVWDEFASRAVASVEAQTRPPNEILRIHADSLYEARNQGLEQSMSDWLICLDADDELDRHYIEAMLTVPGDIRQPATLGVVDGHEDNYPVLIPKKPLFEGNYIVIGAMFRRKLALEVGGFRDLPAFEDWDLWARMVMNGARVGECPSAIYKVHVRKDSRNKTNDYLFHQLKREYATMPGVENIQ